MKKLIWILLCLELQSNNASALEYQWKDVQFNLNSRLSVGAAMRMQDIDYDLVGKLNVPGQTTLCEPDDCISFLHDPAPNQRLVNARGAFSGANADNGDLSYRKHSLVAATGIFDSDLKITYDDFLFRIRGIGFYDPANTRHQEHHTSTLYQPEYTQRDGNTLGIYARNIRLMEAYGQYNFQLNDHDAVLSVGQQNVRWGESTLIAVNSINEINPPNAAFLHMPGVQVNQVFQPVPLALLSFDVMEGVSMDLLYQFGWKPVQPDAEGSFFSTSDIGGGGKYAMISTGAFSEDPNQQATPKGLLGLMSSTSFSTRILPENFGYPRNAGQYGVKLGYNATWLNGGTELGFYFLNYHSRFPYASVFAANDSCARDATDPVTAIVICHGFNGSMTAQLQQNFGLVGLGPLEPAPIDTLKAFLDYPENIHMFGVSFNTNIGSWSVSGEYSYRPNMPLQVQIPDLVFGGLQPSLPRQDQDILGILTLPGAGAAFPSYVTKYRGLNNVVANQYIPGYQRFKVGQFDITGIKAFSNNIFAADQILLILEAGFTHIYNLPSLNQLQIEGGALYDTQYGPGADGTATPDGKPDTRHINPTHQSTGFATAFSWGLRSIIQMEYNDVVFGWTFKPQFILLHDMTGIAPSPNQNFVQGRSQAVVGTDINFSQNLTGHLQYDWYWGGGRDNSLADRDNLAISLGYSF